LKAHDVTAIHDSYRERAACSLYTAMGVIGGRWNPMISRRLEQLRQIEADGVVVRRALNPARMGVRFRLTPYGRTLHPVFEELWSCGTRHLKQRGASQATMVRPPQ
jgi:DNA-binding HxlR family transcriptional regulator